jgi:hypothetical protein
VLLLLLLELLLELLELLEPLLPELLLLRSTAWLGGWRSTPSGFRAGDFNKAGCELGCACFFPERGLTSSTSWPLSRRSFGTATFYRLRFRLPC